jgi:hypothetical protein
MNWPPEDLGDWILLVFCFILVAFVYGFGKAWGQDIAAGWFG